jgi:hypothetical protein
MTTGSILISADLATPASSVPLKVKFELAVSLLEARGEIICALRRRIARLERALTLTGSLLRPRGALLQ